MSAKKKCDPSGIAGLRIKKTSKGFVTFRNGQMHLDVKGYLTSREGRASLERVVKLSAGLPYKKKKKEEQGTVAAAAAN